ncbi:hypothetical protein Acid7E03_41670 [Acidisoma sp. 7E03]
MGEASLSKYDYLTACCESERGAALLTARGLVKPGLALRPSVPDPAPCYQSHTCRASGYQTKRTPPLSACAVLWPLMAPP